MLSLILWVPGLGIFAAIFYLLYTQVEGDLRLTFANKFGKPVENLLAGKVIWIVGASSGIGEGIAIALARSRCKLILSARREAELERVRQQCTNAGKIPDDWVMVLPMDAVQMETHQSNFQKIINQFGKLDILIYNAGYMKRAKWEDATTDEDKSVFDLNVFAPVALTRVVLPHFVHNKAGHVVAISSISAYTGFPRAASYAASKLALGGFLETLRLEHYSNNINVTLVFPGPVATDALVSSVPDALGHPLYKNIMSVERCAQLTSVAIANQLPYAWITRNPVLIFAYISYYCPRLGFALYKIQAKWNPVPSLQS